MRLITLIVGSVMLSAPLAAQAPFPGGVMVNGGWVPCSHPIAVAAGLGCVETTVPSRAQCERVNPYTQPALAVTCRATYGGTIPALSPAVFRVGQRYYRAYPSMQMTVLAVSLDLAGREVVTAQWAADLGGAVFAFINDGREPWIAVTGGPS